MLTKIVFQKIQLQLRHTGHTDPKHYWVSFRVKASFCHTEQEFDSLEEHNQNPRILHFSASCSIYFESEDDVIEIKIYRTSKEGNDLIISLAQSLRVFMKTERIDLQQHSEEVQSLTHAITTEVVPDINYLQLSNILIDYMPLASKNEMMLLQVQCLNDRFRVGKPNKQLYWPETVRIYTNQKEQISFRFVDNLFQNIPLTELKLSHLKHQIGFRKHLITNDKGFPIGCIQFEYKGKGLTHLRQNLKQIQSKQLYKIEIMRIKGKLKQAHSNIRLKILSDLNYFQTGVNSQTINEFCFQTSNYLYSSEPKCNFIISGTKGEEDMVANGVISLHMLGKFDRKVVVEGLQGNQQIGSLIVSIACLKVQTKALRLKNISLKLDKYSQDQLDNQIFVRATVGGIFGKTETHNLAAVSIIFITNLQVRYSNETQIQLQICFLNNEATVPTAFSIDQLQKNSKIHKSAFFKSECPLLEGRLSLDFQYFLKIQNQIRQKTLQIDQKSAEEQLECCCLSKPQERKNDQKQLQVVSSSSNKEKTDPKESSHGKAIQEKPQQTLKLQTKCKKKIVSNEKKQQQKRDEFDYRQPTKKSVPKVSKKSDIHNSPNLQVSEEDVKSKQRSNKFYIRGSDRFQHIVQIYMGSNASRLPHASRASTSKNRSKSHSTKQSHHDRCQLPQLPQVRNKHKITYSSKLDSSLKAALENRRQL